MKSYISFQRREGNRGAHYKADAYYSVRARLSKP